jgi:Flp pilus assembly protein TadD
VPSTPDPTPAPERELPPAVLAAAAVAAVLVAHGLALANGFAWDDQHTVVGNAALRSLANLWRSFGMDDWQAYGLRARGLYRPLATASLFLDHALFGLRPAGWHATSLALHALTALGVMRLARSAGARSAVALACGVLFAVHPITSEAADWVSARPDGLMTCLAIWALVAAQAGRVRLGAVLAALACFAKEPGLATVPAVIAIAAGRAPRRRAIEAAVIALGGAALYLALRRAAGVPVNAGAARLASPSAWLELAGTFGAAAAGAARAFLWPIPLDAVRRLPDLGLARWVAAAAALAAVALAAVASLRRRDGLPLALATAIAVPLALAAAYGANLSERYLLLPAAAVGAGAAAGLDAAVRAGASLRPSVRRLAAIAGVAVLAGAAAASAARARAWRDPLLIFASATEADPGNADAWQLFGAELHRHGARREALAAFDRAASLGSQRAGLHSNLCALRREQGDLAQAATDCDRAVLLDPADPRPRYNRALLWAASGRREEAVAELRAVAAEHPAYRPAAEALVALGAAAARAQ